MTPRVLVVEDHFPLRLALKAALLGAGFVVEAVGSAEEAAQAAEQSAPAVIVLDWNLPGISGVELLRRWREAGQVWPVSLLTARDAIADRVSGLQEGANDYMVKPFANEELVARIHVQLRQHVPPPGERMVLSGLQVDLVRRTVLRDGETLTLTTKEVELLAYLSAHPGQVVSREDLLREVWGFRGHFRSRSADNTILRLRAKIEPDPARPTHILTVHGVGYRFEP